MDEIIDHIVTSVYNADYKKLEQIIDKGKNNLVFKIEIEDELQIIRLSNSKQQLSLYEKEKWCANIAKAAGIHTPQINDIGVLDSWSYSFQEYIAGTHGTEADQKETWFKIGQTARTMHQIPAAEITLTYTEKIDGLFGNDFFVEKGVFTPELSSKVKGRLNETLSWEFSPILCHGNLHPSNVILDDNRQLWLIDWETASGNRAPQADLAEIYTWNNGKDNIAAFCEGHGLSTLEIQTMMRDIQTLVLLRLLEVVHKTLTKSSEIVNLENPFIKNTAERLTSISDYQTDILFTKNL